jgi:hypothetical protein
MVTIVSGLPRSGTSLMMQMLHAGGMPLLTDGCRTADADNPAGYFELERVKQLKSDHDWLAQADGKAVKIVSLLLFDLPSALLCRVIFMTRALDEILASQAEMLRRRGATATGPDDAAMRRHFENHLAKVQRFLDARPRTAVYRCSYNALMASPQSVTSEVAAFAGPGLDAAGMMQAINPLLYRQRKA